MEKRTRITCCHNCPDRYPGCHGKCEKYKQQREEYDASVAELRKRYFTNAGIINQQYDGYNKATKSRHYRSKFRRNR